jgi:hypothetical protein
MADNLSRLFRRDKRNWKPEIEMIEVEKLDYVEPKRIKRTFRYLRKMKKFDRKIPPKRTETPRIVPEKQELS